MNNIIDILFDKYKNGDICEEEILVACLPVIKSMLIKKFNGFDDDLIQESMIVALDCLKKYNEDVKCTFTTYLCNKVKWVIGRYVWNDKLIKKPVYLFEKGIDTTSYEILSSHTKFNNKTDSKEINIIDLVEYDNHLEENFTDFHMLKTILYRMNKVHRDILILWSVGYTFKEISKICGISHSGAEQKVKRALNIARNLVKNSEFKNEYNIEEKIYEYSPDKTKTGKTRKTKYSKELLDEIRKRELSLRVIAEKYSMELKTIINLDQRIKKGRL